MKHNLSLAAYKAAPLLKEAVSTANALNPKVMSIKPKFNTRVAQKIPTDDATLSGVLQLYGAEIFKKQLGPNEQWAPPAVSGSERNFIGSLARFEDGNSKMLDTLIAAKLNGCVVEILVFQRCSG